MREVRTVPLHVRQKAERARKAKEEAQQRANRTGTVATLVFMASVFLFIVAQYV